MSVCESANAGYGIQPPADVDLNDTFADSLYEHVDIQRHDVFVHEA